MTDGVQTELAKLDLPFGRRATLRKVKYDSGLRMVRLVLKEGTRITQVDMDDSSAQALGRALVAAAGPDNAELGSA